MHAKKQAMYLLLLAMFIMAAAVSAGNEKAASDPPPAGNLPFYPGEKLTYQLSWGFIPAGEAVLEVLPVETYNGIEAFHFVLTTRTNAVVDVFYKVRDRIDSYTDLGLNRTIYYKKSQQEGNNRKEIVVEFDWEKGQAQFANFGEKKDPIEIMPGSLDPLSVFYFARQADLKVNSDISRPVTDGEVNLLGQGRIVTRENVKVGNATYDTFLLEPDLKDIGGVFEKDRKARIRIWLTADERRQLVRLKSKVVVGSFVAELVSGK